MKTHVHTDIIQYMSYTNIGILINNPYIPYLFYYLGSYNGIC